MVEFKHHRIRRRDRQHLEVCLGEMLEELRETIGAREKRGDSGGRYFAAAVVNRESLDWVVMKYSVRLQQDK